MVHACLLSAAKESKLIYQATTFKLATMLVSLAVVSLRTQRRAQQDKDMNEKHFELCKDKAEEIIGGLREWA
jgi:flagellin-specific chaperone FliS